MCYNINCNALQAGALLKAMIDTEEIVRISRGANTRYAKRGSNQKITPVSQVEKVLKLVEDKLFITNQDIQKLLCINADSTNVLLSGMHKKGLIIRLKRGQYTKTRQ